MKYKTGDVFPQLTVTTSKGVPVTIPVEGGRYTTSSSGAIRDARFATPTSPSFAGAKLGSRRRAYTKFFFFTHRNRMWPLFTATFLLTRSVTAKNTTTGNLEWSPP